MLAFHGVYPALGTSRAVAVTLCERLFLKFFVFFAKKLLSPFCILAIYLLKPGTRSLAGGRR